MLTPGEVTLLLQRADNGDCAAADALYRLVEGHLRAIAARRKQGFAEGPEASTTVLVDDAFCKLVGNDVTNWQPGDRRKFYAYMANKMHDLLVDAARARLAQKRSGELHRCDLEALDPAAPPPEDSDFIIDLKEALNRLQSFALADAEAFRIYYFLGCTFDETAAMLRVSATEVKRQVRRARMWLQRELKGYANDTR